MHKYWEYTNSDTGLFCFMFGFLFFFIGIAGLSDNLWLGIILGGFGLLLILCGVGWVIRYIQVKDDYERCQNKRCKE